MSEFQVGGRVYDQGYARESLDEPLRPYHCLKHHCYHVGHPPGWKENNR